MRVRFLFTPGPAILLTLAAQPDLRRQVKDTGVGAHWIYDDIPRGFEQAEATGKPLLVLFRCVP